MVQLIARRKLVYAGKRVDKGGTFNATDRDAFLLSNVAKSADRAPVDPDAVPVEPPRAKGEPVPEKRKRGRPRKARDEPPAEPVPPAPIDPPLQDEQPEGASPVGVSTGTLQPGKRVYRRRDMQADDAE